MFLLFCPPPVSQGKVDCPTHMLPWKPEVAPYSPFILLHHPSIDRLKQLFIHPSPLLINDAGEVSSKQGHFELCCHRNLLTTLRVHAFFICHPSIASSCCTIKIGGDEHNASHPPVNHSRTWITQPPWGDYLHESFNLISAYLRQMSQEILLCACCMCIFSIRYSLCQFFFFFPSLFLVHLLNAIPSLTDIHVAEVALDETVFYL